MRNTSRAAVLLLALFVSANAAKRLSALPKLTSFFRFQTTYDNNPFRYSGEDLEAFRSSAEPARFPIRSADDLEIALSGGWKYRYRTGRRPGFLRVSSKLYGYVSNWEKSYGWVSAEVSQEVCRRGRLKAGFLWMPGFLIRHYRSHLAGGDDYLACRFAEYLTTVSFRQQFGPVVFEPRYRYEVDDYLEAFDYYDTRAHRAGAELAWEIARGLRLAADYEYKLAAAAGRVPDISYRQHAVEVTAKSSPKTLRSLTIKAAYGLQSREYTTENPPEEDLSHAERGDLIEHIAVELGWRFGRAKLVGGYEYTWREVHSPYSEYIEDIKKYRRNRFSLGVVLSAPGLEAW